MAEILIPTDMGFAEFVAKLIQETFEAVVTAQSEQEQRQAQLADLAALSPEEFASRFIADEEVDAELGRLFPTDTPSQPHAIFLGARFQPLLRDTPETPPIRAVLGVELLRSDYRVTRRRRITSLKPEAVDKVKSAVRLRLTAVRLAAIREAVARGIPQVIVDSGRINAKLTFQIIRTEDTETPEIRSRLVAPLKPLGLLTISPTAEALANIRLTVRQADEKAPQTTQLQVNVFGEVEITFKTII